MKLSKFRLGAYIVATAIAISALPAAAHADMDIYQRMESARIARENVNTTPYIPWKSDCAYFVSLALWDGGMKSDDDWTPSTSDGSRAASRLMIPGPSKAAMSADHFVKYMARTGRAVVAPIKWSDNTAGGAKTADVIAYDWENGADGTIDHIAIVTGFASGGYPLVSQHTPAQLNRGWSWSLDAGQWIEYAKPGAKAYLVHFN
ncbi:amidase domain-containing protein [Tsukamurella tyrosinosolvens]|uniref:amidase domain-containing protein n=1 Tax=Tsukamurella tyrosinosolvens TaxID=57704 RepID=UPI000793FE75|nr:amidase domain-containing protein [Tsukamurella tyrosinosolvens]KXP04866.1 hypothetical protein AXK59_16005 [Tsukamurella tyrosinosolvens]